MPLPSSVPCFGTPCVMTKQYLSGICVDLLLHKPIAIHNAVAIPLRKGQGKDSCENGQ